MMRAASATRLASQAVGLEGLGQEGAGRPAPCADLLAVGVGGERPAPIKHPGPCTGAPLVWRLARRACGLRSSAPLRRRFRNHRRISEAHARKHIPRPPSSSVYIHYEPQNLSPARSLAAPWHLAPICPTRRIRVVWCKHSTPP